jgi:fermentation-respiration switch protein FrsA (DUF1100 family)
VAAPGPLNRTIWPAAFIALLVVGALAFLFVIWFGQRGLLYFPGPGPVARPATLAVEDAELRTEDGLRLGAWFVPPSAAASGLTVLVCNGNAGDRSHRAGLARALAAAGHAVLLFDYRGFGGNPGSPTEQGLRADARAAVKYLEQRSDVDPARIVYFGESLGAAVGSQLASERRPFALVLRSPFPSLAEVGRVHYPYLPVTDALLWDRYRTSDALAEMTAPVLVVTGDRDEVVPTTLSRQVHDALRGPKRFALIAGAGHNEPEVAEGPLLVGHIGRFLDDVAAGTLR